MKILRYMLASFLISAFFFTAVSKVSAGAVLADLENALMCQCDDKCGKVLINCTCDRILKLAQRG